MSKRLWAEAANTTCHTINCVYFHLGTQKTPYELWKGKKPSVSYFHIFGSTCYILNDHERFSKFYSKSDTSIFHGYSNNSKAYRVFNIKMQTVIESVNVVVDVSCDLSEFQRKMLFLA